MKLNSDIDHSFAEMIEKQSKMKFELLEKLESLQNKLYSTSVYNLNEYEKIKKYMSFFESVN